MPVTHEDTPASYRQDAQAAYQTSAQGSYKGLVRVKSTLQVQLAGPAQCCQPEGLASVDFAKAGRRVGSPGEVGVLHASALELQGLSRGLVAWDAFNMHLSLAVTGTDPVVM